MFLFVSNNNKKKIKKNNLQVLSDFSIMFQMKIDAYTPYNRKAMLFIKQIIALTFVFSLLLVRIHPLENDVGWKRSSLALDLGLFTGDQCSGWKKVCLCT